MDRPLRDGIHKMWNRDPQSPVLVANVFKLFLQANTSSSYYLLKFSRDQYPGADNEIPRLLEILYEGFFKRTQKFVQRGPGQPWHYEVIKTRIEWDQIEIE